jgi:Asp-tRNA(Asn)/Glu-tRNA(Gln) amidotransferase A subunit family amidase
VGVRSQRSEPEGPQDSRVDRRAFLSRLGALTVGAVTGVRPEAVLASRASAGGRPAGLDALLSTLVARPTEDPTDLSIWEAVRQMRDRRLSPSELLRAYLDRVDRWDDTYLAYNLVLVESATSRARNLDDQIPTGLLHGIPLGIKDNFYTEGILTTANSHVFRDFVPEFDATVVRKLKEAGGIVLGKTQMGPLATTRALTPDGEITTVNAWAPSDPRVSPGGSSSGSATAVAARLAGASMGTQTGGSITTPAMLQGLTGLKPTMGRVSLHGVIPLTHTRDHPGPIARDATDAALLLQTTAGPDPGDFRTLGLPPVPDYLAAVAPVRRRGRTVIQWPTRIGVPQGWIEEGGPALRVSRERFLEELGRLDVEIRELKLPPRWEELTSHSFNAVRLAERSELFLDVLRADVRLFGVALSSWINGLLIHGDEYLKGQRARVALLRLTLEEVFRECELVIQSDAIPFDMIGLPLITFPIGQAGAGGNQLPTGVLVGGLPFGEERLLALAAAWQSATDWHLMRPPEPGSVPSELKANRGQMATDEVARLSQ